MAAATRQRKPELRKANVRAGDTVEVIAGKYVGRRGKVEKVFLADGRVLVEGINIVKRHTRPRPPANAQEAARRQQTGGVIEKAAPLNISNVLVVCPGCDKPTRIGIAISDDGRKERVCRHKGCGVHLRDPRTSK